MLDLPLTHSQMAEMVAARIIAEPAPPDTGRRDATDAEMSEIASPFTEGPLPEVILVDPTTKEPWFLASLGRRHTKSFAKTLAKNQGQSPREGS